MKYVIRRFANRSEMLDSLADAFLERIQSKLIAQGSVRIVFGGGRTQKELNDRIVALGRGQADWSRVVVYLSDERCVALDHGQSNYFLNLTTLALPLGIPSANVHPFNVDSKPETAAADYDRKLRDRSCCQGEFLFDLALLGLGPDGHTASLFPGSPALNEKASLAAPAGKGPEGLDRITLTYPALNRSDQIWIMAAGREKSRAVSKILSGSTVAAQCPAAGLRPSREELTLWLDQEAAVSKEANKKTQTREACHV